MIGVFFPDFYWLLSGFDTVPMAVSCRTTSMRYGQFCIYTGDRGGDTVSVQYQLGSNLLHFKFWLASSFIWQWRQYQFVVSQVRNKLVSQFESVKEILLPQIDFLIPLFSVTYLFLYFGHPEVPLGTDAWIYSSLEKDMCLLDLHETGKIFIINLSKSQPLHHSDICCECLCCSSIYYYYNLQKMMLLIWNILAISRQLTCLLFITIPFLPQTSLSLCQLCTSQNGIVLNFLNSVTELVVWLIKLHCY